MMDTGYIAVGVMCFFLGWLAGVIAEERHSRRKWTQKLEQAKQAAELAVELAEENGRAKERLAQMEAKHDRTNPAVG